MESCPPSLRSNKSVLRELACFPLDPNAYGQKPWYFSFKFLHLSSDGDNPDQIMVHVRDGPGDGMSWQVDPIQF